MSLVTNLKRMVKELQTENMAYEEELTGLKKSLRSTKMEEMQIELDMFTQEGTRLRKKAEKLVKNSHKSP